ncbi:zonular occludens toxin domain-containing protein [Cohnella sp. GCM10020058]|uniref:zonular occludens toxin domain-containing protein n=1 Tax=Cohnella sp. GCM10020058 TaxID=3317330 RepID=UPI00362D6A61
MDNRLPDDACSSCRAAWNIGTLLRRPDRRALAEGVARMISMYSGTIGSGKSYHALEDVVEKLSKGFHVIGNFPLTFTPGQIRKGMAARYMFLPDDLLMGVTGISVLLRLSRDMGWDEDDREGLCLVVIDEATNFFPREDAAKPEQKLWRAFFTQTRKLGFDFILIVQDDMSLNKTINKCIEYDIKHRKINNVFPFKYLPWTIFMYVKFWKQQRQRLGSSSSIFVKSFARMYKSKRMFANLDEQLDVILKEAKVDVDALIPVFGNCIPEEDVRAGGGRGAEGTAREPLEGAVHEQENHEANSA